MKRNPEYERTLAAQLEHIGCMPADMEYRFCPTRRWRFDLAYVAQKIAVEIEGGMWARGRHTRPVGYQKDMEKYRMAEILGWKVLRYSPKEVKTWEAAREIASLLLGREVRIG